MIRKRFTVLFLLGLLLNSCVSAKLYEDLKSENEALQEQNRLLAAQLDERETGKTSSFQKIKEQFITEIERLKTENTALAAEVAAQRSNYDRLKDSYDALATNSDASLSENLKRNRELLTLLEAKQKALNEEALRLQKLEKELANRTQRVTELEGIIAAKEAQMNELKTAISEALTQFEGNGLTVEKRDGKVYVSMENKLLFESGSWAVNTRGKEAVVSLGNVLAKNPEISVLIEGHTDNVPYGGNGNITNNWELSTKRATSIVAILLQNKSISENTITAAGRGEFAPVASNSTSEGRAKNRRIEVILTPKLDEISRLLNE